MDLLMRSGFDFEKHKTKGIPSQLFAEYILTSGMCLTNKIHWITFQGGVDFGYMLRALIGTDLPNDETGFFDLMSSYF